MKKILKSLSASEKGGAFVVTLVLLLIGGLILAPLLAHMGTGHLAGQVHENLAHDLYAVDAGVEHALARITAGDVRPPKVCGDPDWWPGNVSDVNARDIGYNITFFDGPVFLVESQISREHNPTRVEAYIVDRWGDYSRITDHILCTKLGHLHDVHHNVALEYDPENAPYPRYPHAWPTAEDIIEFYQRDLVGATHYNGDTIIDLNGVDREIGPLYVEGELKILNSSNTPATLTLEGTIYVTRDLEIGVHGKKNLTLHMDGNTIFTESSSVKPPKEALQISDRCDIRGPGAIVAVGDIYFAPNGDAGTPEAPVFLISVTGTTRIRPGITICGAIAGDVDVTVQSGDTPTIKYPPDGFPPDLNFPGFDVANEKWVIASWTLD